MKHWKQKQKAVLWICLLLLSAIFATGCDDPFGDVAGDYQGFALKRQKGSAALRIPVQARANIIKNKQFALTIFEGDRKAEAANFTVSVASKSEISLSGSALRNAVLTLKIDGEACFSTKDATFGVVVLCHANKAISIEIERTSTDEQFTLTLDRLKPVAIPIPEIPQSFTVQEVVQKTLERNFDSRIQFEHAVQARLQAKTAYLNLLPHISMGSITAVAADRVFGLLSSVGDIAPFLIPSRWIQAKSASQRSEAENDALILMRADSASVAEGLCYVFMRDLTIQGVLYDAINAVQTVRNEIRFREKLGQFIPGTSDDLTAVMNSTQQDIALLNLALKYELRSISQSMGFTNPDAVENITGTTEYDAANPSETDDEWLKEEVLKRSIELRQMDSLVQAARYSKTERYFTWLDPAGDYQGGLGLNLLTYVPIGASQIRELLIKRDQLQAILQQKAANLVSEKNNVLDSYRLAVEGKNLHAKRVNRYLQQIRIGTGFDLVALSLALQDYVKSGVAEATATFAYSIAAAKVNRMLFSGLYSGIALQDARR